MLSKSAREILVAILTAKVVSVNVQFKFEYEVVDRRNLNF